jgi:hypothetical protein
MWYAEVLGWIRQGGEGVGLNHCLEIEPVIPLMDLLNRFGLIFVVGFQLLGKIDAQVAFIGFNQLTGSECPKSDQRNGRIEDLSHAFS